MSVHSSIFISEGIGMLRLTMKMPATIFDGIPLVLLRFALIPVMVDALWVVLFVAKSESGRS